MEQAEMTNKQALFIIWNAILNQSQDAQKTINSTLTLMERLGLVNDFTTSFEKLNYDSLFSAMTDKPMIHRFYNKMTRDLYFSVGHIMNRFEGFPYNVFSVQDKQKITNNLLEFKGIGAHKAEIAYMIFDLYKSNNSNMENIEQNFNSCPALYKTLDSEFEILNILA
jgi:hypothetical protein